MTQFKVPLIIRGEIIEDYEKEFQDRSGNRSFLTADVGKYASRLVCQKPETMIDLYSISLEDIYDFLAELGNRLNLETNPYWREAFEVSCHTSNLSRPVLEHLYRVAGGMFSRGYTRDLVEKRIGSEYLEGWVPQHMSDGRTIHVRAMGTRSVHIIAGNVPSVSVGTVMKGSVTRNDVIIKAPSNDPLTAVAIARTMIDMAPDHPLTRHLSIAYWKGGDEGVESRIYQASHIDKIVAWGGYDSIRHISRYLGPGIDLVTLDPKSSTTLIGKEALVDEPTMREVARRVSADMGGWDQEACVNARVMFLESGTNARGIEMANRFGQLIHEEMQKLPRTTSCGPQRFDPRLKSELNGILSQDEFYKIITGPEGIERTGAVIISQMPEQVDFPGLLYGRVGNLVPLDTIDTAIRYFSAATQTVSVFPDSLRKRLRDIAALRGGQMFQPVGYAIAASPVAPQDGIEPERRMCTWVVDNDCDPAMVQAPWLEPGAVR